MDRIVRTAALIVLAIPAVVVAQNRDANQVLSAARAALGGDKLTAVKTVTATGRTLRTGPTGNTIENDFELALELPEKYRLRSALVAMGNMSIYRHTGFNGSQLIEETDTPPNLSGGGHVVMFRVAGPGGAVMDPAKMTPEQKAEFDKQRLVGNKKEFARLALGVFAASLPAFPLAFTYAGQAEAPDGKADVIDVKGEGDFNARLFVDATTHVPLMLTWMDKEPLIIRTGAGAPVPGPGPGAAVRVFEAGPQGGHRPEGGKLSKEELEKLEKDLDAKRAEAEANRKTVEYRVYYGDYRQVGGITFPHRIQRSIDGKTTEEMVFESVKVNGKIAASTFNTK